MNSGPPEEPRTFRARLRKLFQSEQLQTALQQVQSQRQDTGTSRQKTPQTVEAPEETSLLLERSPLFLGLKKAVRQTLQPASSGIRFTEAWAALQTAGVPGYGVPLAGNGFELGQSVVVMVCEEMGRMLFQGPYLDTMKAVDLLSQLDPELSAYSDWLPAIASGDLFFNVIGLEEQIGVPFAKEGKDALVLNKYTQFLSHYDLPYALLIVVGQDVFCLSKEHPAICLQPSENLAGSSFYKVTIDHLRLPLSDRLNQEPVDVQLVLARTRLRQAAYLLGLADGSLSQVISYARESQQYDRRLVEQQHVQSSLVSLLERWEAAKLHIQSTAQRDDQGQPVLQLATQSLAMAAEIALAISEVSLRLHEALGINPLPKIQQYYRTIALEAMRYGTPHQLWQEAGEIRRQEHERACVSDLSMRLKRLPVKKRALLLAKIRESLAETLEAQYEQDAIYNMLEEIERPWIKIHQAPDAQFRLVCFPHAGANSYFFTHWSELLAPAFEIITIELPGHGSRIKEQPYDVAFDVAYHLASELEPQADKPLLFLGHSGGALLAFETSRILLKMGVPIYRLFALASRAPHAALSEPPRYHLPEREFLLRVNEFGGLPEELLASEEVLRLMLPALRADEKLAETYFYRGPIGHFPFPISVYGGKADRIGLDVLQRWGELSTEECELRLFDGGHFFLQECELEVFSSLVASLS